MRAEGPETSGEPGSLERPAENRHRYLDRREFSWSGEEIAEACLQLA